MTAISVKLLQEKLPTRAARQKHHRDYKTRKRIKPRKGDDLYRKIWTEIDGVLIDVIRVHPNYFDFTSSNSSTIRESIAKRLTPMIQKLCLEEVKSRGIDSTIGDVV